MHKRQNSAVMIRTSWEGDKFCMCVFQHRADDAKWFQQLFTNICGFVGSKEALCRVGINRGGCALLAPKALKMKRCFESVGLQCFLKVSSILSKQDCGREVTISDCSSPVGIAQSYGPKA